MSLVLNKLTSQIAESKMIVVLDQCAQCELHCESDLTDTSVSCG